MIAPPSGVRVWLATGATDMRRGMNGLALQVQQALCRDPHAGDLYVFSGKRGQRATFYIQFAVREDCLSLESAVRSHASCFSLSARQGSEMYLHGGAAGPLP